MIIGLDHITLIVADLERAGSFYSEVLGFTRLARPAFDFQGLWLSAGDLQVHLILQNEITGPAGSQRLAESRASRHLHFAFHVEDFDQACRHVQRHDVPILDGPKKRPDGIGQLFIEDPDGYILELCESPEIR